MRLSLKFYRELGAAAASHRYSDAEGWQEAYREATTRLANCLFFETGNDRIKARRIYAKGWRAYCREHNITTPEQSLQQALEAAKTKPKKEKPMTNSRNADKFVVRMPDGMRERIAEVAKENHRSMNAEIIKRLDDSMNPPTVTTASNTSPTFDAEAFMQLLIENGPVLRDIINGRR